MTGAGQVIVGRERERGRLVALLDRAMAGSCTVGLLVGEAGIGKSRLADDVAEVARSRSVPVVRGDADDHDRSPFTLWSGVQRRLDLTLDHDPGLPPSEQQWQVLSSLAGAIAAAAPVVVVLEDVHWADESSRWVLERIARELDGASVLLLVTSRDEAPDELRMLRRRAEVLPLVGLDEAELEALASELGAPSVDATTLRTRTSGNPLFVRELLAQRGRDDHLPPVIGDLLRDSLERLDPAVQRTLTVRAVAGGSTPLPVLAMALGQTEEDVRAALDRAEQADVLAVDPAGGLRFRHALLEEAAASLVEPSERRSLHVALATAWDGHGTTLASRTAAVEHRLAAAPVGEPLVACQEARALAAEWRSTIGVAPAIALLERADAVATAGDPRAVDLRAGLLNDLAEDRWTLGELATATAVFESAAAVAADIEDPEVLAIAEAGAARTINMFQPDAARVRRLMDAEQRLPEGDHPLRVALLGRRALQQLCRPEDVRDALDIAEEAVRMARRLDDPGVLVDALCDRHQVTIDPEGIAGRAAAVDEMIELSRRVGRPDLGLRGYEWQLCELIEVGDGAAARTAADRLEALAAVMPSPHWHFVALLRIRTLLHLLGDRHGAEAAAQQARELGAQLATGVELVSLDAGGRVSGAVLWGRPDATINELWPEILAGLDHVPNPFFQIRAAQTLLVVGEVDEARRRVLQFASRPDRLVLAAEGLSTLQMAALLIADLGLRELANPTREVLAPYAGRLGVGNGIGFGLPIDASLGRLATLARDHEAAVAHLRAAVTYAERFPSPPLEARCRALLAAALGVIGDTSAAAEADAARTLAGQIGLDLDIDPSTLGGPAPAPTALPVTTPVTDRRASMRRDGDRWLLATPYGDGEVAHARGVEQLARVLEAGGRELAAVELSGAPGGPPTASDLGPVLDARAKQQYRRRIDELQADIDQAEADHDPGRADRAHAELDALLGELRRAVGLGGRDRPSGSGAERARVNVTRSLKRAVAAVAQAIPDLGAHLTVAIQTGRYCRYEPEPAAALTWTVDL